MLIRKAVLCASLFLLASCAKPFNPLGPAPSVCAEVRAEPVLPNDAGIVAPVTDAEKEATRSMLGWQSEVLDWGREGWSRVRTAQAGCS